MIDVLTLNYNDSESTIKFVDSVKNFSCIRYIVVVDNKSTDASLEYLKKIESPKVVIIENSSNGGYGAGNNLGIKYLIEKFSSSLVLLANPDVLVEEETLNALERFLKDNAKYAVVAPLMKNPSGKVQYNSAFRLPSKIQYVLAFEMLYSKLFKPFHYAQTKPFVNVSNVDSVSGSLFLMNANIMLQKGMFDEKIFLYCEELVLGLKMRNAGYKIALLNNVSYIHNHSVSIKKTYKSIIARNELLMKSRLYVLKEYYKVGWLLYSFAFFLSKIGLFESRLMGCLKRYH